MQAAERRAVDQRLSVAMALAAVTLIVGTTFFPLFLDLATLCAGFVAGSSLSQPAAVDHGLPPRKKAAADTEKPDLAREETETHALTEDEATRAAREREKILISAAFAPPPPPPSSTTRRSSRRDSQVTTTLGVENPHLALNVRAYERALLARRDRDLAWAQEKFRLATEWRDSFDGDGAVAPELVELLRKRKKKRPQRLVRREPLLSAESLRNAGKVLRGGFLYWKGLDKEGRPVIWNHSGGFDFRNLPAGGEDDFVRAVATLIEVGVLATAFGDDAEDDEGRLAYVECARGLSAANYPLGPAWRILKGVITGFIRGYPERGAVFLIAPTTFVNHLLFALATPILPKSLAQRVNLVDEDKARDQVAKLLGDHDRVPVFFGGTDTSHATLPRDLTTGDLDLVAMLRDLIKAKNHFHRHNKRELKHRAPPPPSSLSAHLSNC